MNIQHLLENKTIIYILGPTASGKTDVACQLADHFPVELISVDSTLIYRGMDIGTAKPNPMLLQKYPHALIDICEPYEIYSVAQFIQDCRKAIAQAYERQRVPVCVGGTMMYYQALTFGLAELPQADPLIRQMIIVEAEEKGWEELHHELQKVDPLAAQRIHPNDPQRLQRALEVYRATGKSMTDLIANQQQEAMLNPILAFSLIPRDRQQLHTRIRLRFDLMMEQGFIEEVEQLRSNTKLSKDLPSMRAVGYRQVWDYLDGLYDKSEMQEKALAATRQLAKRQMTWLRNWKLNTHCIDPFEGKTFEKMMMLLG